MENHAIVVLYQGREPSPEILGAISQVLFETGCCVAETMKIVYKDSSSIASALISSTANTAKEDPTEELKNAVIFIYGIWGNLLMYNQYVQFAIELSNAVYSAIQSRQIALEFSGNSETSKKPLLNAVKIIATSVQQLEKDFRDKYHFTREVEQVFREVYKQLVAE